MQIWYDSKLIWFLYYIIKPRCTDSYINRLYIIS